MIKELVIKHLEELRNFEGGLCLTVYLNPNHYTVTEEGLSEVAQKLLEIINNKIEQEIEDQEKQNYFKERFTSMFKDCLISKKKYSIVAHFISEMFEGVYFHLPLEVEEQLFIGKHFIIEPLMFSLLRKDRYIVLVISDSNTRFFEGIGDVLLEHQVKGLPKGIKDVVSEYELKMMTSNPADMLGQLGEGDLKIIERSQELQKEAVFVKYIKKVEEIITPIVEENLLDLIVVGTEQQVRLFQQNTNLNGKIIAYLTGVYDFSSSEEVMEIVKPVMDNYKEKLTEQLKFDIENAQYAGLISDELQQIYDDIAIQNFSKLILNPDANVPGYIENGNIVISEDESDYNLVDIIAYEAFKNKCPIYWNKELINDKPAILIREW